MLYELQGGLQTLAVCLQRAGELELAVFFFDRVIAYTRTRTHAQICDATRVRA